MHDSKQHDEVATRFHEFPAGLQSFLETSARYLGLVDVPRELLHRPAAPTLKKTGSESKPFENLKLTQRGAA